MSEEEKKDGLYQAILEGRSGGYSVLTYGSYSDCISCIETKGFNLDTDKIDSVSYGNEESIVTIHQIPYATSDDEMTTRLDSVIKELEHGRREAINFSNDGINDVTQRDGADKRALLFEQIIGNLKWVKNGGK